ncbi:dolichyl-diphosphooligosaccharide---protein glycotransferase [Synchytrium endobioticum]|uniref:Dolichyl-diphosphooligosaccharide--protein glycosyltransferase subunit 1 n=1 Tax=Synchytrium endobioticum TaxID=286115 RepID=A0A507CI65_9FUNG|nr:dolichyl-diphosphooligosaccharide---protein glycotransferase [Synchytrium endobioticum]TPX46837.1 dolichyl-diphosphooligosaccharide---protein glycotransferase [Synchytrium endobioticum]
MRVSTYVSLFLLAVLSISVGHKADQVPLLNENVDRTVDLASTGAITREVIKVSFRVADAKAGPAKDYLVAVPENVMERLASLDATIDDGRLEFERAGLHPASKRHLFRVKLPKPMKSGTLTIKIAYTHRVKPYPAEIPQGEKQYLEYSGSAYFLSPYPTKSQKTTLKLPKSNVISYSEQPSPVSKSGNAIYFGPYNDIEGDQYGDVDIHVHYEDPKPVLVVKALFRDVWVSHLGGKLSVEEHYELVNEGAKLKGHFSRIDYAMGAGTQGQMNVLRHLSLTFPAKVSNPYYRDIVGNVSTSRFRNERTKSVMEIQPRYPLWGGWKYTWYHGYDAPLSAFMRQKGSRYTLAIPFLSSTQDVAHDVVKLRIVLPEGADNLRVSLPFALNNEQHDRVYWYLDTIGRPATILEKRNAVDGEHSQVVYISYDYSDVNSLRKPLVASLAFFLLFVSSMLILRLDFSILPGV